MRIDRLSGLEILDSRGRPTVQATCSLESGAVGTASVPSGASTGAGESVELRDRDPERYDGLGCRSAVAAIDGELQNALAGHALDTQRELDQALIELDGTERKSRLGANTTLAVSLAFARAAAAELEQPLYLHLSRLVDSTPHVLPRPEVNIFSGGLHAGGQVALQDVLVVPTEAGSIDEALATVFDVYRAAARLALEQYGMRELTADEGGLAPPFPSTEKMLAEAAELASEAPVALSVDVAASHFYRAGGYLLDGETLDSAAMVQRLLDWTDRYSIVAVEDGLGQDDWDAWAAFLAAAGNVLVVGDDLLCTTPARIRRAIDNRAADTLLLKPNQVGTITEAAEALTLARDAGWRVIVSGRSGETEDDWLADLAVGWSADLIKIGSIRQSERLAKYNRLLAIEQETGLALAEI